jgi:hypothetical protein
MNQNYLYAQDWITVTAVIYKAAWKSSTAYLLKDKEMVEFSE